MTVGTNMARGRPLRLMLLFAVPMVAGNLFQQLYQMADTLIIGNRLGSAALGAVGCTGAVSGMVTGLLNGFVSGMSVVTARRYGAEDISGVRRSLAALIVLTGILTLALTGISAALARPVLRALNTPEELLEDAATYALVFFLGVAAPTFFNLFSAIMRAMGDSRTPLLFLAVACTANIALDIVCVLWLGWGVAGVALATVASQGAAALLSHRLMVRRMPWLRLKLADLACIKEEMGAHLRQGIPIGLQSSIIAIGTLAVQAALNSLGAESVIACTVVQRLDGFCILPLMSIGTAVATYVSHNDGAGEAERISLGVKRAAMLNVGLAVAASLGMLVAGAGMVEGLLVDAPEALAQAMLYLRVNSGLYIFAALMFVLRNALLGLGRSELVTASGFVEMLMRSFAALALVPAIGFLGLCVANPMAWLGAGVFVGYLYRRVFVYKVRGSTRYKGGANYAGSNHGAGSE